MKEKEQNSIIESDDVKQVVAGNWVYEICDDFLPEEDLLQDADLVAIRFTDNKTRGTGRRLIGHTGSLRLFPDLKHGTLYTCRAFQVNAVTQELLEEKIDFEVSRLPTDVCQRINIPAPLLPNKETVKKVEELSEGETWIKNVKRVPRRI